MKSKEVTPAGGINEKDEVYITAIAVEEGENDELPPRPVALYHAIRTGIVSLLVIVTQANSLSKVCQVILEIQKTNLPNYSFLMSIFGTEEPFVLLW